MNSKTNKLISIICPVYNEEEAILLFYNRLMTAIVDLRQRYDFELIFTNNASDDSTLQVIKGLYSKNSSVQVITLSRNFGYQSSLLAGLHNAKGDAIAIIDVDCEDPPEMIPIFIAEWEKGYDIVYGKRDKRPEPIVMQWIRKLFYRLTKLIADYDFILDMAEFSLFSSRVRDEITRNKSSFPFIRAELGFVGFKHKGIPYTRERRIIGKTHYNFFRMIEFAIGGILSSSTFFLRIAAYCGIPLFLINIAIAATILLSDVHFDPLALIFLDFAYIIIIVAFRSLYTARIHKNVIERPIYIIDHKNSIFRNSEEKID